MVSGAIYGTYASYETETPPIRWDRGVRMSAERRVFVDPANKPGILHGDFQRGLAILRRPRRSWPDIIMISFILSSDLSRLSQGIHSVNLSTQAVRRALWASWAPRCSQLQWTVPE